MPTHKTKIRSDISASYYISLTAKSFLAYLADRAGEAIEHDEFFYEDLLHQFGDILDFLVENLEEKR